MKTAQAILAQTFGWDVSEVKDYRYQNYVGPAVYAVGDRYYAVNKTKPKHDDVGLGWEPLEDQFAAQGTGRTVWVCLAA